jgi:hypothetical protein
MAIEPRVLREWNRGRSGHRKADRGADGRARENQSVFSGP